MVKCDNCSNKAAYTCADPGANAVNYCVTCLPAWLHARANAGHFPLVEPVSAPEEEAAPKAKKSTKKTNE
jgi:hypothetical protein